MLITNAIQGESGSYFLYDFYCKHCKKYFSNDDVKKIRLDVDEISHVVKKYCPLCNTGDLISVCTGCRDGFMQKEQIPNGGDYDEEGKLELFCNTCGEGFKHVIVNFCRIMERANLSKRNIKKAIDKVFTHKGLPYNEKKSVEKIVFGAIITEDNVVGIISKECHEDENFVRRQLRKK